MVIRKARPAEAELLTELSFASKRYWQYPESFYDVWRKELTLTREYILHNDVFVCERREGVAGYYSLLSLDDELDTGLIVLQKGTWLEHMFVHPDLIGRSIGTHLFTHMRQLCCRKKTGDIHILADPHALRFYEKMGCHYIRECPSTITGRTTPLLRLEIT